VCVVLDETDGRGDIFGFMLHGTWQSHTNHFTVDFSPYTT